jgi:hypothetical protein
MPTLHDEDDATGRDALPDTVAAATASPKPTANVSSDAERRTSNGVQKREMHPILRAMPAVALPADATEEQVKNHPIDLQPKPRPLTLRPPLTLPSTPSGAHTEPTEAARKTVSRPSQYQTSDALSERPPAAEANPQATSETVPPPGNVPPIPLRKKSVIPPVFLQQSNDQATDFNAQHRSTVNGRPFSKPFVPLPRPSNNQ